MNKKLQKDVKFKEKKYKTITENFYMFETKNKSRMKKISKMKFFLFKKWKKNILNKIYEDYIF